MGWRHGETIVHREVWRGRPWCVSPVVVVEDTPELLVTYLPEEAPFAFPPSADGRPHPWRGKHAWAGHGVLQLRRPGEACSVWHFWDGPQRTFAGWYLNLEEPFRRTTIGYDTQDLELDLWIPVDGAWRFKDKELLEARVADGRYTEEQVEATLALGARLGAMLERGERWWDARWAAFEPDPAWRGPSFPDGWEEAPVSPAPPPSAYRTLA
ncbi:MAG: DUF402 domain-containing protein [Gaiella sp.]|nr:DUF402 domain-containing protein [Gaiella sp.]